MASTGFTFEQIKLNANENITNSVLNRALIRLWKNIDNLKNQAAFSFPEATQQTSTILIDVYDPSNINSHTKKWYPISNLSAFIPKSKLTELADITSSAVPNTGETIVWNSANGASGQWQYSPIPKKIQDLTNFDQVSEDPLENSVLTYTKNSGWLARLPTKFVGVGYIYHEIFSSPYIITLPDDIETLNGGEQVVITKILPENRSALDKFPILIKVPNNSNSRILNSTGILTNNDDESFCSIHLRAVRNPENPELYVWVPVCATGSWKPTNILSLDGLYDSTQTVKTVTLTGNQIKLQPYNIDVSFSLNGADISKNYNIILKKTGIVWNIDAATTSAGVTFDNNIISINHNILEGTKLTKATVYFNDLTGTGHLSQIIPDEIYFGNSYSTTYIDISSWCNMDDSITTLDFKVVISI